MKSPINLLALLKWVAATIITEWLAVPNVMRALIVLMAIDYTSGILAAFKLKRISSEVGWWGLVKKLITLLLLLGCYVLEQAIGADWKIEQIAALGYCVNECVSVVKNCSLIGIPIPAQLVSALVTVQRLRSQEATPEQLRELDGAAEKKSSAATSGQ